MQEMHDLTDLEAVQQFAFNIQWHYALNITADADRDAYLCPKTLWSMRSLITREGHYGLIERFRAEEAVIGMNSYQLLRVRGMGASDIAPPSRRQDSISSG